MPKLIKKKWNRNHINLMKKAEAKPWLKVAYSSNQHSQQTTLKDQIKILKKDKFNCPICFSSVVEPVITICGHLYCCKCIEDVFSEDKRCSYCDTALSPTQVRRSMISEEIICQVYLSTLSIHDQEQPNRARKASHLWKHAELKDMKVCGLIDFYENALDEWRSGIVISIKKECEDNFSIVLIDLKNLKLVEKTFHPFNFADCLLERGKVSDCIDPFAFLAADTKDRLLTSKIEKYWQNIEEFKTKRF